MVRTRSCSSCSAKIIRIKHARRVLQETKDLANGFNKTATQLPGHQNPSRPDESQSAAVVRRQLSSKCISSLTAKLVVARQRRGKLSNAVIQKRRTHFQRNSHACTIDFLLGCLRRDKAACRVSAPFQDRLVRLSHRPCLPADLPTSCSPSFVS